MMGKIWNFLRTYRVHLGVTLLFLAAAALIPFSSYYERTFSPEDLEISGEALGMTVITEDDPPALLAGVGGTYTGIVAETGGVTLQDGTYRLQVVSLSECSGNRLEVYDIGKLNTDNTQGQLLESVELSADQEITELEFTTEDSLSDVSFRFVYGGEGLLNVSSLYLVSTEPLYTDILWLMAAVLLFSLFLLIRKARGKRLDSEGRTALLLLTAAVLLASAPLGFDAVLDGNDLYYQFNRFAGIQEALKSGQFPVKIHSTLLHGYGYGSPIFYPEWFLYLPALLGCAGVSLVNCYKLFILLLHAGTAALAYISFTGLLRSRRTGLAAALLYTLSVYRLIDVYTRAAVGEALAMAFLPLVIWGMYELFLGNHKKWYLAALGFTGIMQSHVLTTEMTLMFGGIFGLCFIARLREQGRFPALLKAAGAAVFLNLGRAALLLQHMQYPFRVVSVESVLSWWTMTLPKMFDLLLFNTNERTYAGSGNSGEMPCSLGFVLFLGILAFLYVWLRTREKSRRQRYCMFALVLAVFGIYLSSNLFPWDRVQAVPLLSRIVTPIQIPWRFLALSTALLCPVCAAGFEQLSGEREKEKLAMAGVFALAFLCAGIYVNRYSEEALARYTAENQYQREQAQVDVLYFMNVDHANSYRIWNRDNTFVPAEGVQVDEVYRNMNLTAGFSWKAEEEISGEEGLWVDVPYTYYPNYRAYAEDGTRLQTAVGDQGVVRVILPDADEGTVRIIYQEPWYVAASRLVSAGTALGALAVCLYRKCGKKNKIQQA